MFELNFFLILVNFRTSDILLELKMLPRFDFFLGMSRVNSENFPFLIVWPNLTFFRKLIEAIYMAVHEFQSQKIYPTF